MKKDLNDPENEPVEMTSLKLELSTLSTSYSSLQSTLILMQTQLVDLKRVQEENEYYMILLRKWPVWIIWSWLSCESDKRAQASLFISKMSLCRWPTRSRWSYLSRIFRFYIGDYYDGMGRGVPRR